jgi:hypothetical protein
MSQALANVVQTAAARMLSLAVSIREASMSKEGRQDHLKKIGEFKEYLTREGRSEFPSDDERWKHGVDVIELGKNSDVVKQFLLSLKPQRQGAGVNVKATDCDDITVVKGLPALKKYRASVTFLFTENCVQRYTRLLCL